MSGEPYRAAAEAVGREIPLDVRVKYDLDPYRIARLAVEAHLEQARMSSQGTDT